MAEIVNFRIPYGVFDFKRIRDERLYNIGKTGYIPLLDQAGRGRKMFTNPQSSLLQ